MVFSKLSMIPTINAFTPGNMLKTLFLTTTINIANAYQHVARVDGLEVYGDGANSGQLSGTGALAELQKYVVCHVCGSAEFAGLYDSSDTRILSAEYTASLSGGKMLQTGTSGDDLTLTQVDVDSYATCKAVVEATLTNMNTNPANSVFHPGQEAVTAAGHIGFNFSDYTDVHNFTETNFLINNGAYKNYLDIGKCTSYDSTEIHDPSQNETEIDNVLSSQIYTAFQDNGLCANNSDMNNISEDRSQGMICRRPKNVVATEGFINCASKAVAHNNFCRDLVQGDSQNVQTDLNALYEAGSFNLGTIYAARNTDSLNRMLFIYACLNTHDTQGNLCVPEFTVQEDPDTAVAWTASETRTDNQLATKTNSPLLHKYLARYSYDFCMQDDLVNANVIEFTSAMGNGCV